jgi:hypothetical protein
MSYLDLLNAAKERLRLSALSEEREKRDSSPFVGGNENEVPGANEAQKAQEAGAEPAVYYAHPWPDVIPHLGSRHMGPYVACSGCGYGTFARYGSCPLCLGCAKRAAIRETCP